MKTIDFAQTFDALDGKFSKVFIARKVRVTTTSIRNWYYGVNEPKMKNNEDLIEFFKQENCKVFYK